MGSPTSDVLLHPIRLRIVLAMSDDELTTGELAQRLADVPTASLYRHVAVLAEAGVLEIVAERRVRGGVERTYRVVSEAASLGPEDAAAMSRDEHMTGFVTFVGALVDAFSRYLDHAEAAPGTDVMGYRQLGLWLSAEEAKDMLGRLRDVLGEYAAQGPEKGRKRVLFNTILIPDATTLI